jgi:2-O-(6-phospho-alpha-D-mannosyl)-D-glycerate hydrolase
MKKLNCHVISNTHWDREWRYPFQSYRMDLVEMIDELLDIMEKRPDYRAFYMDSQTVMLEDYLEIRPENEERIKKFVQADRLQIGPWYTLPDEWGCPGEALVRNLLIGHRVAKKFGPVQKVGYTPFSNGQVSQLPQVYQGFGIDSCFYYRGIGKHVAKSEFIWEGADDSQIFGFKFGDYARYNYYYLVYRAGLLGRHPDNRSYTWNPEDVPYHIAVDQAQDRQYGWGDQQMEIHHECLTRATEDAHKYTEADATTSELLYMMGHDHSFPTEKELDLIEALQEYGEKLGDNIFHSALNDYMVALRREAKDLQVLKGEMRHTLKIGLWTTLMAHILSCRLYLKQRNAQVNAKIIHSAEPMAAMGWMGGKAYPEKFLEVAWKHLLINQAHDAIGGCSVDPVHEAMLVRWAEVETISDEICRRSMRDLMLKIDGSAIDKEDLQLTVFNTLVQPRSGVAEFIIDLPFKEEGTVFSVETVDGQSVAYQVKESEVYNATIEGPLELTMEVPVLRCRAAVELKDIPAMGYEALVVKPAVEPQPAGQSLLNDDQSLENEFLKVEVNSNGTLKLTDKKSGRVMDQLGYLEDTAEFGDPWSRITPEGEVPIYSKDRQAKVAVQTQGDLESSLRIDYTLPVPKGKGEGIVRSEELVDIPVSVLVTLKKGSPLLGVTVEIDNCVKDHRLRILFPSGIEKAVNSFAEGQLDVLERPIKVPDGTGFIEKPFATHPMWNFVGVTDDENGVAIINDGLIEYEVIDDEARTIAVTLLRAFNKFQYARPTPGSQCLGQHTYRFAIYPFKGSWEQSDVLAHTARHITKPQAILSAPGKGTEPTRKSFLSVSPASVVFSAVKASEEGGKMIVRYWNPLDEEQEVTFESVMPILKAERISMEEIPEETLEVHSGNTLKIKTGAKKIVTVALDLGELPPVR